MEQAKKKRMSEIRMNSEENSLLKNSFTVQDWGQIDYSLALKKQELLVEKIAEKNSFGVLVFCSHPPVVTLGRKTQKDDVFSWQGPVIEIARGGRATYHGPSQIVVYPIFNLNLLNEPYRRDIGHFLRGIEQALINSLQCFSIAGQAIAGEENTGVWVKDKKIASIGIGVRKWISYHGAALNLDFDPKAFQGLNPCGFKSSQMTNIESELGHPVSRIEAIQVIIEEFKKIFNN